MPVLVSGSKGLVLMQRERAHCRVVVCYGVLAYS